MQFVFLIGAARSGTKFLRDLLASSEAVSCVPYDVNYVWRYRNETLPDDRIPVEKVRPAIRSYIEQMLARMAKRSKRASTPIVIEKSVSNVFRVPFIYALFPDAKFVHLLRDGRDVALSAAKQWEMPDKVGYLIEKTRYFPIRNVSYAFWSLRNILARRFGKAQKMAVWGPRYPGIDGDVDTLSSLEIAAKQWAASVTAAEAGLALIPDNQKFTIRYEDLVTDAQSLDELLRFLNLPDAQRVRTVYEAAVDREKSGRWRELPNTGKKAMLRFLEPALRKFGYNDS